MPKDNREKDADSEQYHETIARREAAWGMYGAIMREQNFNRGKAELERDVSRAAPREKKQAERSLDEFLQSARRQAGTVYIGSGIGNSDPEDFD